MASRFGGLIQDQNLNVHYSVGGKTNASKPPRKGGLGGRKPLGDLSNSVKATATQASQKQNASFFSFPEKETGASKITYEASKKKSISKASEKVQSGGRKALSDISNSGKPSLHEASKKNQDSKLCIVAEEPTLPSSIANEGFLHNHQECIKGQSKAIDVEEFLKIVGLDNDKDFSKQSSAARTPPVSNKMKFTSSLNCLEFDDMAEQLVGIQSPRKDELLGNSPCPTKTPKQIGNHMPWNDHDFSPSFKLTETPYLLKY